MKNVILNNILIEHFITNADLAGMKESRCRFTAIYLRCVFDNGNTEDFEVLADFGDDTGFDGCRSAHKIRQVLQDSDIMGALQRAHERFGDRLEVAAIDGMWRSWNPDEWKSSDRDEPTGYWEPTCMASSVDIFNQEA
jgi:hypothetical protein